MDQRHKDILTQNRPYLAENLDPRSPWMGKLLAAKIFSKDDLDEIKSERTRKGAVEEFLRKLPLRGPTAFMTFLVVLKSDEGQAFIANELAKLLTEEEKSAPSLPFEEQPTSPTASAVAISGRFAGTRAQRSSYLPPKLDDIVGRDPQITAVVDALQSCAVCWIWGPPGCGKSAVAIAAAYKAESTGIQFIHVDAKALINASEIFKNILSLLQLVGVDCKSDARELLMKASSLDTTPVCFFVDNYGDIPNCAYTQKEDAEFEHGLVSVIQKVLTLGGEKFSFLVTAYCDKPSHFTAVKAESVRIDRLTLKDSEHFLVSLYQASRSSTESLSVKDQNLIAKLASWCCGVPFVLKAIGTKMASHPNYWTPSKCYALYQKKRNFLEAFSEHNRELIRRHFGHCWNNLDGKLKATLLRFSVIPGSFSNRWAAAVLEKGELSDVVLGSLQDSGLLEPVIPCLGMARSAVPGLFRQFLEIEAINLSSLHYFDAKKKYSRKIDSILQKVCRAAKDGKFADYFKLVKGNKKRLLKYLAEVEGDGYERYQLLKRVKQMETGCLLADCGMSCHERNLLFRNCVTIATKKGEVLWKARFHLYCAKVLLEDYELGGRKPGDLRRIENDLSEAAIVNGDLGLVQKDPSDVEPAGQLLQTRKQYWISWARVLLCVGATTPNNGALAVLEKYVVGSGDCSAADNETLGYSYRVDAASSSSKEQYRTAAKYYRKSLDIVSSRDYSSLEKCWVEFQHQLQLVSLTVLIGECYFRAGDYTEAGEQFRKAAASVARNLVDDSGQVNTPCLAVCFYGIALSSVAQSFTREVLLSALDTLKKIPNDFNKMSDPSAHPLRWMIDLLLAKIEFLIGFLPMKAAENDSVQARHHFESAEERLQEICFKYDADTQLFKDSKAVITLVRKNKEALLFTPEEIKKRGELFSEASSVSSADLENLQEEYPSYAKLFLDQDTNMIAEPIHIKPRDSGSISDFTPLFANSLLYYDVIDPRRPSNLLGEESTASELESDDDSDDDSDDGVDDQTSRLLSLRSDFAEDRPSSRVKGSNLPGATPHLADFFRPGKKPQLESTSYYATSFGTYTGLTATVASPLNSKGIGIAGHSFQGKPTQQPISSSEYGGATEESSPASVPPTLSSSSHV
eukprot:m.169673 g.169673  ORF g.169673 m.169673 type:complete len:1138 (+) comp39010_c0_seq1:205-3618(+)